MEGPKKKNKDNLQPQHTPDVNDVDGGLDVLELEELAIGHRANELGGVLNRA